MTAAVLKLKKNADRRLRGGHLWIYSNEVDTQATPLKAFAPGDPVIIESAAGKALGIGYVNPNTLICARLVGRDASKVLDKSLIKHRVQVALSLREQLFAKPYYRLLFGESDGLPGLVVDRFGDYLVAQITTAGIERVRDAVVTALVEVLAPKGILLRNNGGPRKLEGLDEYIEVVHGEVPDELELEENGVRFLAPVQTGQKTGWFYDHRIARARLTDYVKGKRVLDLFSYVGGWGVQAAAFGASEVLCVDSSATALDYVHRNAALNNVADRVATLEGDAFDALKMLKEQGERFDLIILDPPAFIKRRKDIPNGERAYRRANELAMRLLNKDGLLVSGSCSMHLQRASLIDILGKTGRHLDRQVMVLEQHHQGPDHPVQPAIVETEYLKSIFCRVLPAS